MIDSDSDSDDDLRTTEQSVFFERTFNSLFFPNSNRHHQRCRHHFIRSLSPILSYHLLQCLYAAGMKALRSLRLINIVRSYFLIKTSRTKQSIESFCELNSSHVSFSLSFFLFYSHICASSYRSYMTIPWKDKTMEKK